MTVVVDEPKRLARRPDRGRLLSARDAEKLLGIPEARVRKWWQRRRSNGLHDYGRDKRNHPLFRERDLVDLNEGRRLRADPRSRST